MENGSGLPKIKRKDRRGCPSTPGNYGYIGSVGQSKYFTCLDMAMGYHQIELEPGEGPNTAFST